MVDEEDGVVQVCVEIESGSLDGVVATVSLNTEDDSALQSGVWSVTVLPRCILKNIVLARRMSLATFWCSSCLPDVSTGLSNCSFAFS